MTYPTIQPYVIGGVQLLPPNHLTVIGSEHIKGGGTTKTTNCMMTAFALARLGYRVRVVSFDREHSSVSWADKAYTGVSAFQVGQPLPWPDNLEVENADTLRDLVDLVHGFDGDYVIIDGGPADPDSVQTVAALCHIVVLPMEPGPLVLEQAPVTVELVREVEGAQGRDIDTRVLLVRVNMVTRVARTTRELLAGSDIKVMDVMIRDSTQIKECAHQVPRNLQGWDRVVIELFGEDVVTNRPNGKEPTT